jgi:hypothetical protein
VLLDRCDITGIDMPAGVNVGTEIRSRYRFRVLLLDKRNVASVNVPAAIDIPYEQSKMGGESWERGMAGVLRSA